MFVPGSKHMIKIAAKQVSHKNEEAFLSTTRDNDVDIDKVLEQHRDWVYFLARKQLPRQLMSPDELASEIDELVQASLITFWLRLASGTVHIVSPKAYLGSIVRSRCIDMIRRRQKRKFAQPLTLDQDGELHQGKILFMSSDKMQDPALEYSHRELVAEVADDVMGLPPCQRYAMICTLKDVVGETPMLAAIFAKHGVNIHTINWPRDAVALQTLRSSLSPARKKLRSCRERHKAAQSE
jgi:DNA-directed RNA polymerase specialized sigma24 family protein